MLMCRGVDRAGNERSSVIGLHATNIESKRTVSKLQTEIDYCKLQYVVYLMFVLALSTGTATNRP